MKILKHLLLSLLLVASLTAPAWAVNTYYFTNCATGGSGTLNDPYCLKPGANAGASFDFLFDGVAPEAAAGDTINLCCGTCTDNITTCTYDVATQQMGAFFSPAAQGNMVPPITIQGYQNDRPEISGEVNAVPYLVRFVSGQRGYFFKNFTFKRAVNDLIHGDGSDNGSAGFGDLTFFQMALKEANRCAWGDVDGVGNNAGCLPDSAGGFIFYGVGMAYNLTIQDSVISEAGGMALRILLTDGAWGIPTRNHTINIIHNTFRNIAQVANIWETYDWQNLRGASVLFEKNYVEGWWGGFGIEQHNRNITVQDNEFNCSTTYNTDFGYGMSECKDAISINDGNYDGHGADPSRWGANADVIIQRNFIHGSHLGANRASEKTQPGWLEAGIKYTATCMDNNACTAFGLPWCCCTGPGAGRCNSATAGGNCIQTNLNYGCRAGVTYNDRIENNMVWGTYDCGNASTCSGPEDLDTSTGIYVETNTPVSVLNNTVVGNDYGIVVDNGAYSSANLHFVQRNIVANSTVMEVKQTAISAEVRDNDIYDASGNIYQDPNGTKTCAQVNTIDDGSNVCLAPDYIAKAGNPSTWNVHLRTPSAGIIDALASGPAYDVDQNPRPYPALAQDPSPFEYGADEVLPSSLTVFVDPTFVPAGDAANGATITLSFLVQNGPVPATEVSVALFSDDSPVDGMLDYVSDTCGPVGESGCTGGTSDPSGLICPSLAGHDTRDMGAYATWGCTITFHADYDTPGQVCLNLGIVNTATGGDVSFVGNPFPCLTILPPS